MPNFINHTIGSESKPQRTEDQKLLCVFIYYVCFLIVDLIKLVSKHRAQLIYTRMTKGEEDEQ